MKIAQRHLNENISQDEIIHELASHKARKANFQFNISTVTITYKYKLCKKLVKLKVKKIS
jgi:hypothetical protein